MKKKGAVEKLIEKIEDYYERNEQLFRDCGEEEEEKGGGAKMTKEEEKELEFLISSLDDSGPSRAVHMPGYPE